MKRVGRFLLWVLAGWVASWLSVGLVAGRPLIALAPASPEPYHTIYLVLLYLSLLAAVGRCWGPEWLAWKGGGQLWIWLGVGLVAGVFHRLVLTLGGWWSPPDRWPELGFLSLHLLLALAVGFSEELVFRGMIFGSLQQEMPGWKSHLGTALFFAAVHLFRPGGATFKLAYALGLVLFSLVLSRLVLRHRSLWGAAGFHGGVVYLNIIDPPSRLAPGLWSGLQGELVAGVSGWLLMLSLILTLGHRTSEE